MEENQVGQVYTQKCTQCGAFLVFSPGTNALTCPYCGDVQTFSPEKAKNIEEQDFLEHFDKIASEEQVSWTTIQCPSCGAMSRYDAYKIGDICPFCGVPIVVEKTSIARVIKPQALIPFQIDVKKAYLIFQKWRKKLWFAPTSFKKWLINPEKFKGVYIPYWTYDTFTSTYYRGLRGDYYYVTVTYVEQGQTKTRSEQRIRWTPVSGLVQHFFDDVLVVASKNLPTKYIYQLEPWNLENINPYDERYLLGFQTEMYQIGLKEGFEIAKTRMDPIINQLIRQDIGGDQQQIHYKQTSYDKITFKHILLPIYLSSFRYKNKVYRFLINGQTGEIKGERPYSFWKIFFFVLSVLIVLAGIIYLFSM
ncbi:MAG: hypothetical protein N2Z72_02875 [Bacteroidales bacterium]|nr:hypothetical protein [Bacteroidales bacterium]